MSPSACRRSPGSPTLTLTTSWTTLCSVAHHQEIHFLWRPVLRDSRDDHVLELATEAGCEIVVTHNVRDFAGSERFGVAAVTPGEFLRKIGDQS